MIMDEEVQAVILALVVVASVFSAAMMLRPDVVEPFEAIGLLDENCKIGYYPHRVVIGSNITLCIFVSNYRGEPLYYKVVYKIGLNRTLPTNTTPSPEPPILEWRGFLQHKGNTTFKVVVPFIPPKNYWGSRVALIFELWSYDREREEWVYTGRWVHLYVEPVMPIAVKVG